MTDKDTGIVLEHDRTEADLKNDIVHFDPMNSVLLLVYFTKEGENFKYYYRSYKVTKLALWQGIGGNQLPMPDFIPWTEPPDGEYPPPVVITERPTKLGRVNIKSLNIRNAPSLNATKKLTTLLFGQMVEYYADKLYPDSLNKTIVWGEIKTVDGKPPVDSFRWTALKYLA